MYRMRPRPTCSTATSTYSWRRETPCTRSRYTEPSLTPDRHAPAHGGQLAFIHLNLPIHDHIVESLRELLRLDERRFIQNALGVENQQVRGHAGLNAAPVREVERPGWQRCHPPNRVFERQHLSLADVLREHAGVRPVRPGMSAARTAAIAGNGGRRPAHDALDILVVHELVDHGGAAGVHQVEDG